MEELIEILKNINITQTITIFIGLWFFYNRLHKKIDNLDKKIDKVDEKLTNRIDKLNEKVEDVDRRLCRIEGSLSNNGHCLFNQNHNNKKAE